jgi:hypothetical protein
MARLNGFVQFRSLINTVAFPSPMRVGGNGYHFGGDIAES